MQQDRLGWRGRARITAEEYNHSLSKLVSTKRRVKPSRKAAFMAAFPVEASPRLHPDEEEAPVLPLREASITDPEHSKTVTTEKTTGKAEVTSPAEVRQNLQVFVRGLLLPKTICLQLDPETSVSNLKALVESESGIQPKDQHLYIGRNFQLCDLLSIRDHGIQQDQNIELRTGGLLGGGLETKQSRNAYFQDLSRNLGRNYEPLALTLGFSQANLDTIEHDCKGGLEQMAFEMLDDWWKKQEIPTDAPEKLRDALETIGRVDLALEVPGFAGPRFDVEHCAKLLVAHYQQTMKVTTDPKEKHRSIEMDDLYVKPQLLQETNMPTPVSSQETKMQAETVSQPEQPNASKEGSPDLPKSQPKKKGNNVHKCSLDSYKDMLVLKSNRLLIRAEAGYGKTTLLKRIAYDWADLKTKGGKNENQQQPEPSSVLGRYKLVFVVEVKQRDNKFDIIDAIFSQILRNSKLNKKDLETYIHKNQERVLILLDDADEISLQRVQDASCENGTDLNGVLSFNSLISCKVIITSRQKTVKKLQSMHADYTLINIVGFDEKDRETYVRKYFTHFESDYQNSFLEKVNGSEMLRSLAEIPLFLWKICATWADKGKLPDHLNLFQDYIQLLFQHKASKEADEQVPDTDTHVYQLGRIALEGLLHPNGVKLYYMKDEIYPKDLDILEWGNDVGLLSFQDLETEFIFSFLHKTFQEYCAAAFLVDLSRTSRKTFDQYLFRIFNSDVGGLEYVLRFCCGLDTNAAEVILLRIRDLLKHNELNKSFHRISMLLLFEAHLENLVKDFIETEKVEFPYELQGEVLVAAHYFFEVGSKHKTLHKIQIQQITATCRDFDDLRRLEDIMTHIQCNPSLNLVLHRISWDGFVYNSTVILKCLKSLEVHNCGWSLVKLLQVLSKTNRH